MDEANHPLTLMVTGLYGKDLPNQNGAPWRLMVPWKYGFKSIKSIVSIRFTEREPLNTWKQLQASEYGFYANVNPAVSHPRWSQPRSDVCLALCSTRIDGPHYRSTGMPTRLRVFTQAWIYASTTKGALSWLATSNPPSCSRCSCLGAGWHIGSTLRHCRQVPVLALTQSRA